MPTPRTQTFRLTPHPDAESQAVRCISGRVSRTRDALQVRYVLEGDLERIRIPARRAPCVVDALWQHTCFEIFVAGQREPHYCEFNFSPSGEWAAYAFGSYRQRLPLDAAALGIDPHITVCRSADRLELDAVVRLDRLSPGYMNAPLVLGLSAVVETRDGALSYWALKHSTEKPDFHHPDAFVLELDEIRN